MRSKKPYPTSRATIWAEKALKLLSEKAAMNNYGLRQILSYELPGLTDNDFPEQCRGPFEDLFRDVTDEGIAQMTRSEVDRLRIAILKFAQEVLRVSVPE